MLDRQAALKRFVQPEDKLLLAKVLDQADLSLKRHEKRFSDFIDPGHEADFTDILKHYTDINYMLYGGSEDCERKLIGFCPDYEELYKSEFPIKTVSIDADKRFSASLSHRDFLGSVLGLGLDRGKLGDIFITDFGCICVVKEDIADYIAANILRVGRTSVSCRVCENAEELIPKKEIKEVFSTVPSLRLDCIVASAFSLSRGAAKALIEGEKVQLNWKTAVSLSEAVKEGDVLSARGYGRAKVTEVRGLTKKGRIGVVIGRFV